MKKVFILITALLASAIGFAQVRTGTDIDTKTFVIGLDNYIVGEAGGLGFSIKKNAFKVDVQDGIVTAVKGSQTPVVLYEEGLKVPAAYDYSMPLLKGEFVVGVHDFTGDSQPELVIAVRDDAASAIIAFILQYKDGKWISIGEIGAVKGGANEIRVFRQTLTIKNKNTGAMYKWTWHKNGFTFNASDKTASAANLL